MGTKEPESEKPAGDRRFKAMADEFVRALNEAVLEQQPAVAEDAETAPGDATEDEGSD